VKRALALCLFSLPFIPAALAQSTATFIGTSASNTFGKDGSVLPLTSTTLPSYATVTPSAGILTWKWPNGTPTWYSNSGSFSLAISMAGASQHEITLYMLDYDPASRAETLTLKDTASGSVLDVESASNFQNGIYYSWLVSGNITIVVQLTGGLNPVVSGVYFDPPPGTTTGASCPVRTHVVDLAWSAIGGATSYNIYKNGVLFASPSTTSFSDSAVTAGASITYGISAIVNGVESAITTSTIVVPSP
jgi:hypothetical protein